MQGHDPKKLTKALGIKPFVDCICLDMEDGVALAKKRDAREGIRSSFKHDGPLESFMKRPVKRRSEMVVRVNPIQSEFFRDDIASILAGDYVPDAIVLPKVKSKEDIHALEEVLYASAAFKESTSLIPLIESPLAILNLKSILDCSSRISGIIFGADDYAAEMRATRSVRGTEVWWARNEFIAHARAYDIDAIDQVQIDLNLSDEQLELESRESFELGFTGRQIIHPKQINPIQKAFSPSEETILYAKALLDEFKVHQEQGRGTFVFQGRMIDIPTVKQFERMLDMLN